MSATLTIDLAVFAAVAVTSSYLSDVSPENGIVEAARAACDSLGEVRLSQTAFEHSICHLLTARLIETENPKTIGLTEAGRSLWTRLERLGDKGRAKRLSESLADSSDHASSATWAIAEDDWTEAWGRVTADRLARLEARRHIVEGVLVGIDHWDVISSTVFAAQDRRTAVDALLALPLGLTEIQARHVLDLQVARRTVTGRRDLSDELDRLRHAISDLDHGSPAD
jgi:hypothetical protein